MEHVYTVKDYSFMTPYYTKLVIDPLMRFIPWWLPANIITLLSNFCIFLALSLTVLSKSVISSSWIQVLVPILILAYATGDFIDGRQARRTGTSSKLGEFLDHFLDIFATGMLMAILLSIYDVTNPALIAISFILSYLTISIIYFEQHKNSILFFEKIGSFEIIVLFIIMISLGFIDSIKQLFITDFFSYISIIDLFILVMAIGALLTFKRSLDRTGKKAEKEFIVFSLLTAASALLTAELFQAPVIMFLMTAYCGSYIGRLHSAYLRKLKVPRPDYFFPILLAAALFFKIPMTVVIPVSISYQLLSSLSAFISGFMQFTKYWVWKNPGQSEELIDGYIT